MLVAKNTAVRDGWRDVPPAAC